MINNLFFLLVGPSGSGKTTIADALEYKYGLKPVPSYTTRAPRYYGERSHTFVTRESFANLQDIVSYTEFCGNQYCATASQVDEYNIFVVDPVGIAYFKENYHGNKVVKVIHITAPEDVRRERMVRRGDSQVEVNSRIANDKIAFANVVGDLEVENIDLNESVEKIYAFFNEHKAESCRVIHDQWDNFEDCLSCELSHIDDGALYC